MKLPIESVLGTWAEGRGPLHRKLSDALREAIEQGRLPAGERLPAERDLAARLAVSRSTVVTAFDTLRGEGLVESRQGSGTRVRAARSRSLAPAGGVNLSPVYRALLSSDDNLISLACAVFPAHPAVAEALAAVVAEDGPKLLDQIGYVPAGLPALREALAEGLTRDGTPTEPDEVLVTTGAQQAVNLATQLLVRPGDALVVESPSFAGTLDVFTTRGARLVPVPVDADGVDVRGVRAAVAEARPAALYLMPTFHNPTGALLAPHRRRDLAALAADSGVPIIEDNALEHTPLDDDRPPPIGAFAGPDATVLTAGSLGKAAWGGLRIGWLRGPRSLIGRLGELKAMADLGSPLFDQAVAARLVPQLDRMRADHRSMLQRNLELVTSLLDEVLPAWEWRRPKGGPSLWIRLPAGTSSAFAQVALRHGVEVIPGDVMSPTGEHRQHLRFPYSAEPPVLEETVRRLAQAWAAYAPSEAAGPRARTVVV
ncbi:MAG TPA: PLP-dependent aminotransferase family protein [Acidimicrobiales bacterium]|jgi:DNA-binding transcriptional MocR family regulator|nr:PLP-dependent aminotransferase family protein [Acidimicrobiales bacterium]